MIDKRRVRKNSMYIVHVDYLGLFGLLSALTIYLPDDVTAFSRCPQHEIIDLPGISYYPDQKFCNVYHKCNCSRTDCTVVESHVCPLAQVYSKIKAKCLGESTRMKSNISNHMSITCIYLSNIYFLDLEQENCESTYVQWVQTHSSNINNDQDEVAIMVSDSMLPTTSSKDFQCEQGQTGKFR
jgi:hypothetical protein